MTVSTALKKRKFIKTFCLKYYHHREEGSPPADVLKEESVHWMIFLCCYLCDHVELLVSYFVYCG